MRHFIQKVRFTCDRCGIRLIEERTDEGRSLPDGWDIGYTHDCGSTGYTRKDDCCPQCRDDVLKAKGANP